MAKPARPARATSAQAMAQGTQAAGHGLMIEAVSGEPAFTANCQCGDGLGDEQPTSNFNHFAGPWERHLRQQAILHKTEGQRPEPDIEAG